jgi:acyl dehydratase
MTNPIPSPRLDERLAAYVIPRAHKHITPAQCALDALSVGLGQDPLDPVQLSYVELNRPLQVLPTMAIVLASPGFWLADPATGVDISKVLHGEQSLRMHSALPANAEVVGITRCERVIDKGPGAAALLYTHTRLEDRATGMLYAEMDSTTFIRDAGGFGGQAGPVNLPPAEPVGTPVAAVVVPTRPEQALWYRLNGDYNPIHADPEVARRGGFERPILHGLCTLGIACQSVLRALAGGRATALKELSVRFRAPVLPGDTIVTEVWADGAFRSHVQQHGAVVLTGRAILSAESA